MSFKQIADDYIIEITQEFEASKSGQTTKELSFRTSLDNFFKRASKLIEPNITTILEPKIQNKKGRPDWRFHDSITMGVYGYIEAKGIDPLNKINIDGYRKQIQEYLELDRPVILTDGIDFVLFDGNEEKSYSICDKPISWGNIDIKYEIQVMLSIFFGEIGYRSLSDAKLVEEVAKRTKLLSRDISDLIALEEDEARDNTELTTITLLKELKETAKNSHDKTLITDSVFSGFISQILTFGLLYAHRVITQKDITPVEKYEQIHNFWFSVLNEDHTNKLMPFKVLIQNLESELTSNSSRIGLWYDDLRRLLSYIKLSTVQNPDFHELYEIFLTKYDPIARFDYGAFYTPRVLAFYTVRLVKDIIKNSLPQVEINAETTKIIDPCCGTGTFIEAIIEVLQPHANTSIIGFEILPAPYALAHYRMSILNKVYPENINIKLTNTLSDNLFNILSKKISSEDEITLRSFLIKEQENSNILARPPLTLIIGNPPSSDSTFQVANEGKIIEQLIDDFRPDLTNRKSRQNTQKQLSNEFIKFLRWTIERTLRSSPSIFSLIIPSSFLKHPSYKDARKYLYEKLSEIWILDFDSDLRSGTSNVNFFKTKQGRLILCGVYDLDRDQEKLIKYKTITQLSKDEKQNFFEAEPINLSTWIDVPLDSESYSFKPKVKFDIELYDLFWPINEESGSGIFLRHCSGTKLAPSHLLVHSSLGQLKRRSKFIANKDNDFKAIKDEWYTGNSKAPTEPKITQNVKAKLGEAINSKDIIKYSYRPFLETYVVLNENLLQELSSLGGSGTRVRPEVRAAFSDENVFGFIVSPSTEDLGDKLHKFTSFCWNLPDNDLTKRGSAQVFCNYFPDYKKRKKDWDSKSYLNINKNLIATLSRINELSNEKVVSSLTFYTYAILSSNLFLKMFKGVLYDVSGKWPRIPITDDKKLFEVISCIGKDLAEMEKDDYNLVEITEHVEEFSFTKYSLGNNSINLKDASGKVVMSFEGLSNEVLDFEVSGYNVLKGWLKMYSYPFYRKVIGKEELSKLRSLLQKIELYIEKINELDSAVGEVFESKAILRFDEYK